MTATAPADERRALLARRSLSELGARQQAMALLDEGTGRELAGPFDRIESPWLLPQGLVPQADDGVVIARGLLDGAPALVAAIEGAFLGGAVGEVGGAKLAAALRLAQRSDPSVAVLVLETGGVRLHEANLGLNAVAEIAAEVVALRRRSPVIAVIPGPLGCFGGMGLVAGLCTQVLMAPGGRLGLNGPEAVESEAGIAELDSTDRALVWSIAGGEARVAAGLADRLVPDDVGAVRAAVAAAGAAGVPEVHRSERLDDLRRRIEHRPPPRSGVRERRTPATTHAGSRSAAGPGAPATSARGGTWLRRLADGEPTEVVASVLRAETTLDGERATLLAVVPDPASPHPRARHGELGLREALALAEATRAIIEPDHGGLPRPIVAVVDLPSQAYGRVEEEVGLHLALAAAVDAAASARMAGHPAVALVVGTAISGGFLAHGLQANEILTLDDPGVTVNAMHRATAARITRRSAVELEALGAVVAPLSYDVARWATLGLCDDLLAVADADDPTPGDVDAVRAALAAAVRRARARPPTLDHRMDGPPAPEARAASRRAAAAIAEQWGGAT